jgi:hypothetical protein
MTSNLSTARSQRGATTVEFAIIAGLFLLLVFGAMELARLMFVFNTLEEVTRRAAAKAAVTSFRDSAALARIRADAVFRTSPGTLMLASPVTDAHVRIDYLAQTSTAPGNLTMQAIPAASLPTCPARNRQICMANPNDAQCIRFVRVRICQPGGGDSCGTVMYQPILPLIELLLPLPSATTIVPAETLGFKLGATPC